MENNLNISIEHVLHDVAPADSRKWNREWPVLIWGRFVKRLEIMILVGS